MSNISITGNEAQFNEKVTFLKDVDIKGTLLVPDQELTLTKLTTPLIIGNPQLTQWPFQAISSDAKAHGQWLTRVRSASFRRHTSPSSNMK